MKAFITALFITATWLSPSTGATLPRWLQAMDRNEDEKISLEEFSDYQKSVAEAKGQYWKASYSKNQFDAKDINGDGYITPDEISYPSSRKRTKTAPSTQAGQTIDPKEFFSKHREFASEDGRSTCARIVAYNPQTRTANLERDDKWSCIVKIDAFIPDDRDYILAWHNAKLFLNASKFKISAKHIGVIEEIEDGGNLFQTMTFEDHRYDITIHNRSAEKITDLSIEYCIYHDQDYLQSGKQRHGKGVCHDRLIIGALPPNTTKTLRTRNVVTFMQEMNSDYEHFEGTSNVQDGKVVGIRIRVFKTLPSGDRLLRECDLPGNIEADRAWSSSNIYLNMVPSMERRRRNYKESTK